MAIKSLDVDRIMDCLWCGGVIKEHDYDYVSKSHFAHDRYSRAIGCFASLFSLEGDDIGPIHWRTWRWLWDNGFLSYAGDWAVEPMYGRRKYGSWRANV